MDWTVQRFKRHTKSRRQKPGGGQSIFHGAAPRVLRFRYRFLLKYTSRDSVELLARGQRGVLEARDAITKYNESSPLYGLIIYRRRKVLIKYVPEGTSRVLLGMSF